MKVVLGGTFAQIHRGHMKLLDRAFEIGECIYIGLTSDQYVKDHKLFNIGSYEEREKALKQVIERYNKKYVIVPINDKYGASITSDFNVIVVSKETYNTALEINSIRAEKGLDPLKIETVDYIMADDLMPISSTRIYNGEIDKDGKRLTAIKIYVGTANNIKIEATKKVFSAIFNNFTLVGVPVSPEVPEQPYNEATVTGALNRAKHALGNADYGIGIEAGLFWSEQLKDYLDIHYVAVLDKYGSVTYGHSSGFVYPEKLLKLLNEEKDLNSAFEKYAKVKDIGKAEGTVGYFSKHLTTRSKLIEQALIMAMIPRLSWEHYYH